MRRFVALSMAVAMLAVPAIATPKRPLTPAAQWDVSGARHVDVTCDGRPDLVMTGHDKSTLYVSVVPGGKKRHAFNFRFAIDRNVQEAVCTLPVRIETYPISCDDEDVGHLDGCRVIKRCRAFSVADGQCDPLQFYWNAKARRIDWYRH